MKLRHVPNTYTDKKDISERVMLCCFVIFLFSFIFYFVKVESGQNALPELVLAEKEVSTYVNYIPMEVPDITNYFKSYMDYRMVTNRNSDQYKFINNYGWVDSEGFMRCNSDRDVGITDDYYLIALGTFYGTQIGNKYRITLDTGRVFYGVLADCKADRHTNSTNQYNPWNNNVVEFIVDTRKLNKYVKYHGSANVYMPLNGNVTKIERIDFTY